MIEDFIKSEEMRNLSDIIPQKYLNLKAVLFLLEVLQTGRADSSKEAYNLYEEELHREKNAGNARGTVGLCKTNFT